MARILIIDDSESDRTLVQGMPADAVDLIITDLYMPDRDGLEVIADASKLCPDIPVMAIRGASGVRDMRRVAKTMGAAPRTIKAVPLG